MVTAAPVMAKKSASRRIGTNKTKGGSSGIEPLTGKCSASWKLPTSLSERATQLTSISLCTPAGIEVVIDIALRKIAENPARYFGCAPIRGTYGEGTVTYNVRLPAKLTSKISGQRQQHNKKQETPGQLVKRLVYIAIDSPENPTIITPDEQEVARQQEIAEAQRKVERFKQLASKQLPDKRSLWQERLANQKKRLTDLTK